jgi:hypothetical protein
MKEAKLPPGVKALFDAHEKVKQAEIEEQKPKPKPTGTVKDRMAALRARVSLFDPFIFVFYVNMFLYSSPQRKPHKLFIINNKYIIF